jgi:hypothetical protein
MGRQRSSRGRFTSGNELTDTIIWVPRLTRARSRGNLSERYFSRTFTTPGSDQNGRW